MSVVTWSFGMILLVSAVWVALDLAVVALAVSGSLGLPSAPASLLGPPIPLTVAWFVVRR